MSTPQLMALAAWFLAGLAVAGALGVLATRQLVRGAFALLATLVAVAGLFALWGSDVLAASQLVVYVGGILVLLLFGVMLTNRLTPGAPQTRVGNRLGAALGVGALGALLLRHLAATAPQQGLPMAFVQASKVRPLGLALVTDQLLVFELASLLLLAALVGAAALSRRGLQ